MSAADTRIPVTLLTGPLGAGKTTLLNRLLKRPELAGTMVLVNEFGEIPFDHVLVEAVDDNILLLGGGCACCAVQGDLVRALRDVFKHALAGHIPVLRRVVIETTGLADPSPVLSTLLDDRFIAERYRHDGTVTAISVLHGERQLAERYEPLRQVAQADTLLLTQRDLLDAADTHTLAALDAQLARINPGAPRYVVGAGTGTDALDPAWVLGLAARRAVTDAASARRWLASDTPRPPRGFAAAPAAAQPTERPRHDERIASHGLRFAAPVDWLGFVTALDVLLTTLGAGILRVKGLIHVANEPGPRVVHAVHHTRYPVQQLDAWPDEERTSRIVFIVHSIDRDTLEKAFAMFCPTPLVAESTHESTHESSGESPTEAATEAAPESTAKPAPGVTP